MAKRNFNYTPRPYNQDREIVHATIAGVGGVKYSGKNLLTSTIKVAVVGLGSYFVKVLFTPVVQECGMWIKNKFKKPVQVVSVQAKTFNEAVKQSKPANPLIGNLIRSGERVVLFSFTGQGKSILAMQWAIELASGVKSCILPNDDETQQARKQLVLVYDAEQEDDDLYDRYGKQGVVFPENLQQLGGVTFETAEQLLKDIRTRVKTFANDGVVVVDNITAICPAFVAEKARCFYNGLKGIQSEAQSRGITITFIIVGHTTKSKDWQPLQESDLIGSCNLSNFATSVFAMGPTKWPGVQLLKQLKGRKVPKKSTVSLLQIQEKPYLHFEYLREEDEAAALRPKPKPVKDIAETVLLPNAANLPSKKEVDVCSVRKMVELHRKGKTDQKIADVVHFSRKTVGQVLNQVKKLNAVELKVLQETGQDINEIAKALGCRPAVVEYIISNN